MNEKNKKILIAVISGVLCLLLTTLLAVLLSGPTLGQSSPLSLAKVQRDLATLVESNSSEHSSKWSWTHGGIFY